MVQYFDKTFFKFLFGFAGMLAMSFVVLMVVGFYEMEIKQGGELSAAVRAD